MSAGGRVKTGAIATPMRIEVVITPTALATENPSGPDVSALQQSV
jgi:hypothetical protein